MARTMEGRWLSPTRAVGTGSDWDASAHSRNVLTADVRAVQPACHAGGDRRGWRQQTSKSHKYIPQRHKSTMATVTQEERLLLIDLQRLLHCMHHNEDPPDQSWQSLLLRAQLAQDLWQSVAQLESVRFHNQLHAQLEQQVDRVCRRAHEIADLQRQNSPPDLVEQIFFRSTPQLEDIEDEVDESFEDDDDSELEHADSDEEPQAKESQSGTYKASPMSTEELQKAQREQMEEAVSQMAAEMKAATQNIHSTIQKQTGNLGEMEDVVEQNVQDVTKVVQNVQQHNANTWKTSIGTWTLLFTLVGVFVSCLLTIFTIPKRADACLFFCIDPTDKLLKKHLQMAQRRRIDPEDYESMYGASEEEQREKERLDKMMQGLKKSADNIKNKPPEEGGRDEADDMDPFAGRKAVDTDPFAVRKAVDTDPFAGRKVVDTDPFAGRKAVDTDPFAGRKVVDTDPFAGRKAVDIDPPSERIPIKEAEIDPGNGRRKEDPTLESVDEETINNRWDSPVGARVEDYQDYQGHGSEKLKSVLDSTDQEEDKPPERPKQIEDVADALLASLSKMANKNKDCELNIHGECIESGGGSQANAQARGSDSSARGNQDSFARSASSESKFSPKDLRAAAGEGNQKQLITYLMAKPEYIDRKDRNGWTALHMAVKYGQTTSVQFLVKYKADVNALTNDGVAPLDMAVERFGENHRISQMLRHGGAKPAERDRDEL
jgi:hypothetical protein